MGFVSDIFGAIAGKSDAQVAGPDHYGEELESTRRKLYSDIDQTQGRQNALADVLLAQSQGQGPNPAQLMLQQATNQNAQQAAGLLASQRGLNPAMAARVAAQQGAQAQQQAAGQGALLGANQQLAAQQGLSGLYGQIAGQQLNNLGSLRNYTTGINQQGVGASQANAEIEQKNAEAGGNLFRSVIGGVAPGVGNFVGGMFGGGGTSGITGGGSPSIGSYFGGKNPYGMAEGGIVPGRAEVPGNSYANDTVPIQASPGEIVIPRSHASSPESAKSFVDYILKEDQAKQGTSYAKVLAAQKKYAEEMAKLYGSA